MQEILIFLEAHWTLSLALVALLFLLFMIELIRLKHSAQRITPLQLTQLINHKNATVIDLRTAEDFAKGHIVGAVSLPLSEYKANPKKLDKFKSKPIVLLCAKGIESPKIAAPLKEQGFHVHVLGGGIQNWIQAEMPVVKD
jgi:rhodanese-related sulfurtransferase